MKSKFCIWIAIAVGTAVVIVAMHSVIRALGASYRYGEPEVVDAVLNPEGSRLYVSYFADNAIVEINTSTMLETRRFTCIHPTFMEMSPGGSHLYALSRSSTSRLKRVNLVDGTSNQITLQGYANSFCSDSAGGKLWIVGGVWPGDGELVSHQDVRDHPDTGRLTEIDVPSFSIARIAAIDPVPVSVWYSAYTDKLYVLHEDEQAAMISSSEEDWTLADRITVYDASSLQAIGDLLGGMEGLGTFPPAQLTSWDDQQRYLAIPDPGPGYPQKSIRVIDTVDDSIVSDLVFPRYDGGTIGIRFAHKVPGSDILWAAAYSGVHDENVIGQGETVIRVNTATQEHEFFCADGITDHFGDFAVSPDSNTLYFTVIYTGEIIVWSPPE